MSPHTMTETNQANLFWMSATTFPPKWGWMRPTSKHLAWYSISIHSNVIIRKMGQFAEEMGVRHRIHGKMHKSVDVAKLQEKLGGSCGVCCQKVSEAEAFVPWRHQGCAGFEPGSSIPQKNRSVGTPSPARRTRHLLRRRYRQCRRSFRGRRRARHEIECLVEIDCGAGRCGVTETQASGGYRNSDRCRRWA